MKNLFILLLLLLKNKTIKISLLDIVGGFYINRMELKKEYNGRTTILIELEDIEDNVEIMRIIKK